MVSAAARRSFLVGGGGFDFFSAAAACGGGTIKSHVCQSVSIYYSKRLMDLKPHRTLKYIVDRSRRPHHCRTLFEDGRTGPSVTPKGKGKGVERTGPELTPDSRQSACR